MSNPIQIHPSAIIDPSAEIGPGTSIGPFTIIGPNVKIGSDNVIGAHSHLQRWVTLGNGNTVDSFVSLGGAPQDLGYRGWASHVEIGDRNVFREYVHINRGAKEGAVTRIGNDGYFMGGAHIGHDCQVGDKVIMVTHAGLGGYSQVGNKAFISAYCAIHQSVKIGDYVMLGFLTKVTQDIPPYVTCVGATDSVVVGLNSVGLKRSPEIAPEDRKTIKAIFHIYYQEKLAQKEALVRIAALGDSTPVKKWLEFVEHSTRGITPWGSHRDSG